MAPAPAKGDKDASDRQRDLLKEMQRRIGTCEIDLSRHRARIRDCYRYALPWRHDFEQNQPPANALDDIFDSTFMTVLEDFAADMLNTFTPIKSQWVAVTPVESFDAGGVNMIEENRSKYQRVVFDEMARSNLYQALQESYLDLGPGTMALCIQDRGPSRPLHCEAIPTTDLLLERGPFGQINGRFRKRVKIAGDEIEVMWPDARVPPEMKGPGKCFDVVEGWWRDWAEKGDEVWFYIVTANGKVLLDQKLKGRGSCPIIVARWSRDSTTAWGIGPTYRSLPDFKALNYLKQNELMRADFDLSPIVSYEDDGVMNVEGGLTPGTWLPRQAGSEPPQPIEPRAQTDLVMMKADELVSSIKRAHYQDRPEQLGRTPPSATQWADEAAERARRMGTPATNLVIELQYPIFERFAFLLNKRGSLPKVELNGKGVALQPVSPLLRAQEQEELVRMDRLAELVGARFGSEAVAAILKPVEFTNRMAKLLGVDEELVNTPAEMQQAIQTLAPILGGGGGGAGAGVDPQAIAQAMGGA